MAFGWVITAIIAIVFVIFLIVLFWTISKSTKVATQPHGNIVLSSIDIDENSSKDDIYDKILKANEDIFRANNLAGPVKAKLRSYLVKDAQYKSDMIEAMRKDDEIHFENLRGNLLTNIGEISTIWSKATGIPRGHISKKLEEGSKFVLFREKLRATGQKHQIPIVEKIAQNNNIYDF